jgi:hypothetical protein
MHTAAREVGDALIVVAVLGHFFALVAVMLIARCFRQLRRGALGRHDSNDRRPSSPLDQASGNGVDRPYRSF